MKVNTVSTRWRRTLLALAAALALSAALISTTGTAAADAPSSDTPATATAITNLPFEASPDWAPTITLATDPAARLVADSCDSGADIYAAAWWKYTAPVNSTFVVHAAKAVGGVSNYLPIGLAVVSDDLATVRSCSQDGFKITDAGATTIAAGDTVYFVTYQTQDDGNLLAAPFIGVYPSTGVVPPNDDSTSPTVIGSLPFAATLDTTLATRDTTGAFCYSKFGVGPVVWYSHTAVKDELVDINVTSDYYAEYVIAPSNGAGDSSNLCGDRQFRTTAGVTYLIGIYGLDEVRNSGRLSLELRAAPAPPTVKITLPASGTVKKKTGVVTLNGTVTCGGTTVTNPVTGNLHQVYRRGIHDLAFTGSTANCSGRAAAWKAKIVPTTFIFKGKTQVTATVTACNSGGCTTATTKRTVDLKTVS